MKKIVVVDLDGSLIKVNSFRYWLLFSFLYFFISFRWVSLIKFIKFIVSRLLGASDRVEMKRDVLSITETLPVFFISHFVSFLCFFINKNVLVEMHKYETDQYHIDLCTAAPICYTEKIAEKLAFSHVFATPSVCVSNWKENIGSEKLVAIEACYGEDIDIECVITDHYDDLPLLARAKNRVLVRPSHVTREIVQNLFEFKTI